MIIKNVLLKIFMLIVSISILLVGGRVAFTADSYGQIKSLGDGLRFGGQYLGGMLIMVVGFGMLVYAAQITISKKHGNAEG